MKHLRLRVVRMKRQSPPPFLFNGRGYYINLGNKCRPHRLMWSPLTMMQSLVISYFPPDFYLPMQLLGGRPWRCSQVYFCPAEEEEGLPPFVDPFSALSCWTMLHIWFLQSFAHRVCFGFQPPPLCTGALPKMDL